MADTCPYCSSEVSKKEDSGKADCSFCEMEITPSVDGKREMQNKLKPVVTPADMERPTRELQGWHTYNLLELLKICRESRREYFNHMRTFKRAGNQTDKFKPMERQSGDEYEFLTQKTWTVENLLRERIGYVPNRVTDNLLISVKDRMEQEKNFKPMVIRKSPDREPPPRQVSIER